MAATLGAHHVYHRLCIMNIVLPPTSFHVLLAKYQFLRDDQTVDEDQGDPHDGAHRADYLQNLGLDAARLTKAPIRIR